MAEMEAFAMVVDILSRESELCALKRIDKRFENYILTDITETIYLCINPFTYYYY